MMRRFHSTLGLLISLAVLAGCRSGLVEKGEISLRLGDYEMAQDFFRRQLYLNPADYEARLGLGKSLLQQAVSGAGTDSAWEAALVQFEACRTLKPSADLAGLLGNAYTRRARGLLGGGDTLAALGKIARAIEIDPRNVEPANLAGIVYFRMGEGAKAEAIFRRAAAADSMHPSAFFNLGMIHWERGEWDAARQAWLRALQLAPEDEDVLYWFSLAEKRIREGGS